MNDPTPTTATKPRVGPGSAPAGFFSPQHGRPKERLSSLRTSSPRGHRTVIAGLALTLFLTPALLADEPAQDETPQRHQLRDRETLRKQIEGCPQVRLGNGLRVLDVARGGYLGVELTGLSSELRSHFGVPSGSGVMVSRVEEDSPAAAAGMAVGDIVTRVGGEEVDSPSDLGREVRHRDGGSVVEIEVWRDQHPMTFDVTLGSREHCEIDVGEILEGIDWDEVGQAGQTAIEGIDWDEIGRTSQEALEGVDWEGVRGITADAIKSALDGLGQALEDEDVARRLENLEDLDIDALETRMQVLQKKLEALEGQIESESEAAGRAYERAVEAKERALERERERAERDRERDQARLENDATRLEREEARKARNLERLEREQARQEAVMAKNRELADQRMEAQRAALEEAEQRREAAARQAEEQRQAAEASEVEETHQDDEHQK